MELMAKILNGDKSGVPPGKQIFVPTLAIKKADVEEFYKEDQSTARAKLIVLLKVENVCGKQDESGRVACPRF